MAIKSASTAPTGYSEGKAEVEGTNGKDEEAFRSVYSRQRDFLMAQSKVRVRLQEQTFVSVNGVNFILEPKVWLEVPEQVAEILAEAGRI